jgi:integrase
VLGRRKVIELRPRLIAAFLRHLDETKGLSPATVRKARSVLSAVLSYAAAMEYIESNPVMRVPPPEASPASRIAPTIEETARLLLKAEETDPEFLTFLWVTAEEGGRRGETLALRWRDVDFDHGTLTISRTVTTGEDGVRVRPTTKTGCGRTIAVSALSLARLREHRGRVEERMSMAAGCPTEVDPDDLVFSGGEGSRRTLLDGRPWRPESTSRRFRKLKVKAGVRREIDLHGLRHTIVVTELLAVGVDPRTVMGRAGHRSEATTITVYAKVRPAVDSAAAEMWGQIFNHKLIELRAKAADELSVDDAHYLGASMAPVQEPDWPSYSAGPLEPSCHISALDRQITGWRRSEDSLRLRVAFWPSRVRESE